MATVIQGRDRDLTMVDMVILLTVGMVIKDMVGVILVATRVVKDIVGMGSTARHTGKEHIDNISAGCRDYFDSLLMCDSVVKEINL